MAKNDIEAFDDIIHEIEVDPSWQDSMGQDYREYRKEFERLKATTPLDVPKFPISLEIESSYFCNLRCPYCARATENNPRKSKHMPPELWELILAEIKENGLPSILMDHEGEALMNPRLEEMVGQARDAGVIDIWLHTNGILLTRERSAALIEAGLTKLNVSIDAAAEETYNKLRLGGSFEKVCKNIHDFILEKKKRNADYLRVRVSFCFQEDNAGEYHKFIEQWQDDVNMITFQDTIDMSAFEKPDVDYDVSQEELEKKYSCGEKYTCDLPWLVPIIDVEGNVLPCGNPIRRHNEDFILGNLFKGDTIKSCWNSMKMNDIRALLKKGQYYRNSMCRVCAQAIKEAREKSRKIKVEHNI
jgi:MoaA/NifB/PqqE/SkfB family radical SAM enzyme